MTPSKYQEAIYKAFKLTNKNINISAVAGSGKTTTLLELLRLIPSGKDALFLAFNKSIVEELKTRCPNDAATIMTIHSCGWRALLIRYGRRARMNPTKTLAKTELALKRHSVPKGRHGYFFYTVPRLLDLMRCNLCEDTLEAIRELAMRYDVDIDDTDIPVVQTAFKATVEDASQFDFMDMIYVPVVNPAVRLKKYDYVFCDESQDFSLCQQEFIRRCLTRGGRLVTVGDPNQAIYGFAGADADSYSRLAGINGQSISLPLSVCYRCARAVVEEAQRSVPSISPAPGAEEGIVRTGSLASLRDGDWVLCRNLKPLLQVYFWLIRNRVKCVVRGRDIAESVVNFISKTGASTLDGLMRALDHECSRTLDALAARGVRKPTQHPRMEALRQKQEVITYLSSEVTTVSGLISLIRGIFSDKASGIVLSTIHKAKGLENDRIFLVCPELLPSRYATQPWQLEQEEHLRYVAITRARRELVYVPKEVFEGDIAAKVTVDKC